MVYCMGVQLQCHRNQHKAKMFLLSKMKVLLSHHFAHMLSIPTVLTLKKFDQFLHQHEKVY